MIRQAVLVFGSFLLFAGALLAEALPPAPPAPAGRGMLPQTHEYQKVLRNYMATLKEEDFAHGVTDKMAVVEAGLDTEALHRIYIKSLMEQPCVGFKRGIPAVNSPAWLYLLSTIEGPVEGVSREEAVKGFTPSRKSATIRPGPIVTPTGIVLPPVWPDALVTFTQWDYPGNPFRHNRALKMRAFVTAAVNLIMLDDFFSSGQQNRSDWNAYKLITLCSTYRGVSELLPAEVCQAYLQGVRRFAERILEWGRKGEQPEMDMTVPPALWYATAVLKDADFTRRAEAMARKMMTDPAHFHPAGYWVERGGVDVGFGGMANFFAVWLALASDWDFAKDTVERAYRLRAHLSLPEADGSLTGPSHFNARIGTQAAADQWDWEGARDLGAVMVTPEAAHAVSVPTAEQLAAAPARRINIYTRQLHGSLRNLYNPFRNQDGNFGYIQDEDLRGNTWRWRLWDTYNFPATINPGYEFCRPDAHAQLQRLQAERPEMFKVPYLRGENFLRNFADVFFAAKQAEFAAILHTGPVGDQAPDDGLVQYSGPLGFGGGQLSAFWTPATGSVVLGRRAGMTPDKNFDELDAWRLWPVHAVSGRTETGVVFTSARILRPAVAARLDGPEKNTGSVKVSGVLPQKLWGQEAGLAGRLEFARTFEITADSVRVETAMTGDGADAIAELYESIPVYLRNERDKNKPEPTAIMFNHDGAWGAATAEFVTNVNAVRLIRCGGAVEIRFDKPQRAALSPAVWTDSFITRASCRNILIDLRAAGGKTAWRILPAVIKD